MYCICTFFTYLMYVNVHDFVDFQFRSVKIVPNKAHALVLYFRFFGNP